jgi:endonuclease/exonuclease/phosphatase family metal-dependent hydrolase
MRKKKKKKHDGRDIGDTSGEKKVDIEEWKKQEPISEENIVYYDLPRRGNPVHYSLPPPENIVPPREYTVHYSPPNPPQEKPVHYNPPNPPQEKPVHYNPPNPPQDKLVHPATTTFSLLGSTQDDSISFSPKETVPKRKFLPEKSFTIVCFNIRCDVDDPPHNWESRKYEVFKNIHRYKPSIVCLQESTEKVKQFLCNSLSYDAVGSYRDRSPRAEAGHVLFDSTKWKLLSHASFVYTEAGIKPCGSMACNGITKFKDVKDKHTRIFTHVRLMGTSEIHVINTHFPLNKMLQMECAKQLGLYINAISASPDTPIVVAGDFNSHYEPTSNGTPLQELLIHANLSDVNNLENIPTFGNFRKVKPTTNKLDYILFRGLKVLNAGVSDYRYGKERFRPSDHQALFANFVWNSVL